MKAASTHELVINYTYNDFYEGFKLFYNPQNTKKGYRTVGLVWIGFSLFIGIAFKDFNPVLITFLFLGLAFIFIPADYIFRFFVGLSYYYSKLWGNWRIIMDNNGIKGKLKFLSSSVKWKSFNRFLSNDQLFFVSRPNMFFPIFAKVLFIPKRLTTEKQWKEMEALAREHVVNRKEEKVGIWARIAYEIVRILVIILAVFALFLLYASFATWLDPKLNFINVFVYGGLFVWLYFVGLTSIFRYSFKKLGITLLIELSVLMLVAIFFAFMVMMFKK